MRRTGHFLEYTIDMPRSIVWIAFAEAEMMSGWWGEAQLEPYSGGMFRLELRVADGAVVVPGSVSQLVESDGLEPSVLELAAPAFGTIRFALTELPGGTRGASTVLTVAMENYPLSIRAHDASTAAVQARWDAHIDDLVGLLLGHPVDWNAAERAHTTG